MRFVILGAAALVWSTASFAAETITYTYDAQGRLIRVVHTGSVNNNVDKQYTHDNADNRVTVTVTGAQQ